MNYNRKLYLSLVGLIISIFLFAQEEPKYELRSTFIASVANLDWPKYINRNKPDEQKAELQRMFDLYKATNLNAVFLQVRPECDALYNSAYEPWSRYLTWTQGDDPGYDPLAFALEEAHKRGLELHVWMNPYRINASTSDGGDYYHSTHIYKEHPEWAIEYGSGKNILNPGRPEVMSYIGSVVRDLVKNYSVDGVHFDDYFYSYDGTPSDLDAIEYGLYGGSMSLSDWRRDNVNRMIDTVYKVIQEERPNVRFGVSPFGIYKNGVPSGISGMDAYSQIYCDPLAWLEAGSVDYLTPQLYWPTGGSQDFETLANWWADQCFANNRHLYTAHGLYRFSNNPDASKTINNLELHETKYYFDPEFMSLKNNDNLSHLEQSSKGTGDPVATWTLSQIGKQIDIVRFNKSKNGLGSVHYRASDLDRVNGLVDYLVTNKYTHPTLIPTMSWKTLDTPSNPMNLRSETTVDGDVLIWDHNGGTNIRYAVYMTNETTDSSLIILNQENLVSIVFENQILFSNLEFSSGYNITVTAISAIGNESIPSSIYTLDTDLPLVELVSPSNETIVGHTDKLVWSCNRSNADFLVQISTNSSFASVVYQSDWQSDSSLVLDGIALEGEKDNFWRVRAKTDSEGPFSSSKMFTTGFPSKPELISPINLSQNVSTKPRIVWETSSTSDEVVVLVSKSSSFSTIIANETFDASLGESKLNTLLDKNTWYYAKIKAINSYGESEYSDFKTFQTTSGTIPDVSIISPDSGSVVASVDYLVWETTTTEGTISYQVEISFDEDFSSIMVTSEWISETSLQISEINLEGERDYYWRVKAKSEFGEGDYSVVRSFTTGYPARPAITSPQQLSENNSVQPLIGWDSSVNTDSIYAEFSENNSFESISVKEWFDASLGSSSLVSSLSGLTWYYVRIAAKNEFGLSVYSSLKYFKTEEGNSINNTEDNHYIQLYPNKISNGEFYVKMYIKEKANISISAYDVVGNRVALLAKNTNYTSGEVIFNLNIEKVDNGLYFIIIEVNNETYSKRVIVY